MPLNKQAGLKHVICEFGERAKTQYTFLCTEELFLTLEADDFVVVGADGLYKIVRVIAEDNAPLAPSIIYKRILKKL